MRKGWKIFWIVCALCAGMGFVCCIVALVMGVTAEAIEDRFPGGIHLTKHVGVLWNDGGDYDDDDYDDAPDAAVTVGDTKKSYKNVSSIDMDIWAGQVEIITVDESTGSPDKEGHHSHEVTVVTKNIDKRLKLKYYMDGNELKIRTKKKQLVHINNTGKIYIYVPKEYRFEEASLYVGAGELHAEDIYADELYVGVGAGEARIESFTAEEAELDCGTGEIAVAGTAGSEADIVCGVGKITFEARGRESDYNYSISCGIGEVQCGSSRYSGIGTGKEIDNSASKEMAIECGIGGVVVYFTEES